MKYCPYWPARVSECEHFQELIDKNNKRVLFLHLWNEQIAATPPFLGKMPKNRICVLFFGTKN